MDSSRPTPVHRTSTPQSGWRPVRRWAVLAVLAAVAAAAVVTGLLATHTGGRSAAPSGHRRTATTPPSSTSTTVPPTSTTVDPGLLPQTGALPSASDPTFTTRMDALWSGVEAGTVQPALPAFFPESAYVSLKAVGDPAGDYTERLLAEYGDDVVAAHALLGPDPAAATLVGVEVTTGYGHWVPPGVCDNSVGYYELPNARVVYSLDGRDQSFGIAVDDLVAGRVVRGAPRGHPPVRCRGRGGRPRGGAGDVGLFIDLLRRPRAVNTPATRIPTQTGTITST